MRDDSDAKASLLEKLNKMAERIARKAESPLLEHEAAGDGARVR